MPQSENDLYDKAIELSKRLDERFLELARTLRQIKDADAELFRLCVEDSRISLRKAYYLLQVEETFTKLNVPEERLRAIGWTKLQIVAKHIEEVGVEMALKMAEIATVRHLKVLSQGSLPDKKQHCVLMYLSEYQFELLAKALVQFGAKRGPRGLGGKEKALTAFLEAHNKLIALIEETMEKKT